MAIYGYAAPLCWAGRRVKKSARHLSLEPVYIEIMEEVGKRLETALFPKHTLSPLMNKAAQLWVNAVKVDRPDLREFIETIEQRYASLEITRPRRSRKQGKPNVVPITKRQ